MIREIQRIEPLSAIRVGFFMGILTGFVFGILESLLLKSVAKSIGTELLPPGADTLVNMGGGATILLAIVTGLLCSLLFAMLGGLLAIFYNWAARVFGGFEIHMSAEARAPSDHTSVDDDASHD